MARKWSTARASAIYVKRGHIDDASHSSTSSTSHEVIRARRIDVDRRKGIRAGLRLIQSGEVDDRVNINQGSRDGFGMQELHLDDLELLSPRRSWPALAARPADRPAA